MKGLCFIGCGGIAAKHAKLVSKFTDFDIYFASRDKDKAESYKNRFGGKKAFGSYDEAVQNHSVDVLFVCTAVPREVRTALTADAPEAHR